MSVSSALREHSAFQLSYLLDNTIALIKKEKEKSPLYEQYGVRVHELRWRYRRLALSIIKTVF